MSLFDLRERLAYLRPALPRYMLPRRVHMLDAMPRSPNGKIRIDALPRAVFCTCMSARRVTTGQVGTDLVRYRRATAVAGIHGSISVVLPVVR